MIFFQIKHHLFLTAVVIFFILLNPAKAQNLTFITTLPPAILENSGLLNLNGKLLTHNDSGGEPKLYEFHPNNGEIIRTIHLNNASNVDWEDLCQDDEFIYVADLGNNAGARSNLQIYRFPKAELHTLGVLDINAESIHISYKDQTNFESAYLETRYDAEALIDFKGRLFIFTKNWLSRWTNIYEVPKSPGNHILTKIDSIRVPGVITSGTYNQQANSILLTGYNADSAFVTQIDVNQDLPFSSGNISHHILDISEEASHQIESICSIDAQNYFISAERNENGEASLYKFSLGLAVNAKDAQLIRSHHTFNANRQRITSSSLDYTLMSLYDSQGKLLKTSTNGVIKTNDVQSGVYILKSRNTATQRQYSERFILR